VSTTALIDDLKACTDRSALARLLGVQPKELSHVLYILTDNQKYVEFCISKKSGGTRQIRKPCGKLKYIQHQLLNVLYESVDDLTKKGHYRDGLSFGFRRNLNIVDNADVHRNRRWVFNIDIADFFDAFNFGRVRGFFIKDKGFQLNPALATNIAQIACFQNILPQGSPTSPFIADLVAGALDVRMVRFLKSRRCEYSRYADDITISTDLDEFPHDIANLVAHTPEGWKISQPLDDLIVRSGFSINPKKTRMSRADSRQMVTGLVVNRRPNIAREFYLETRSMVDRYVRTGSLVVPSFCTPFGDNCVTGLEADSPKPIKPPTRDIAVLEGRLAHIMNVKDRYDVRSLSEKQSTPTQFWTNYVDFKLFKEFVVNNVPLIITEGPSDVYYLKTAISSSKLSLPHLITNVGVRPFRSKFFSHDSRTAQMLNLRGGFGSIKHFIYLYRNMPKRFNLSLRTQPIVLLIDNDAGGGEVIKQVNGLYKSKITLDDPKTAWEISKRLILVKTPHTASLKRTCIEDLLPQSVLKTSLNGKTFHSDIKTMDPSKHYGKVALASHVRSNISSIDLSSFDPFLLQIEQAIDQALQ
jgi:RNA-directed DNA polymerase